MTKLLEIYFGSVKGFYDAESALHFLHYNDVSFVLSDIELPGMSGLDLAEHIRSIDCDIGVAIVTSFVTVDYLKRAVDKGLLGYLEKPIVLEDLKEILQKYLQKMHSDSKKRYIIEEEMVVDIEKMELKIENTTTKLSQKETMLLEVLLSQRGSVVHQETLLSEIWGAEGGSGRALRNLILRARKKFGEHNIIKSHLYSGYYID